MKPKKKSKLGIHKKGGMSYSWNISEGVEQPLSDTIWNLSLDDSAHYRLGIGTGLYDLEFLYNPKNWTLTHKLLNMNLDTPMVQE